MILFAASNSPGGISSVFNYVRAFGDSENGAPVRFALSAVVYSAPDVPVSVAGWDPSGTGQWVPNSVGVFCPMTRVVTAGGAVEWIGAIDVMPTPPEGSRVLALVYEGDEAVGFAEIDAAKRNRRPLTVSVTVSGE